MSGPGPSRTPERSPVWPSRREWWEAWRWVLLAFTLVVVLVLLGSFVPYRQVVERGHPWLPLKTCPGCLFCGMTHSFCAMSAGRLGEALGWNRGGPALYIGGWLWVAGAALMLLRKGSRSFSPVRREFPYEK